MSIRQQTPDPSPTAPEGTLTGLMREVFTGDDPGRSTWDGVLAEGARIGRFELVREIGRGGFGSVWEARDTELKRKVAFKAIHGSSPSTADERALAEAETAAHLSHPNIVTLHDVGRSAHGPFLVMELLQGEPLSRRLERGPLAPREALRLVAEIARGLAHAHARGVVHRDLTPGNVFLSEGGGVKILDLGIAQILGRDAPRGGTPGYMSPERLRGQPEDARSDVHSLGVILYRMLSGRRPPVGEEASALPVPDPPGLSRLLVRMLADDPAGRPASAGEVLQALEALQGIGSGDEDGEAAPARRRRSILRVAAPVVLVAAVAVTMAVAGRAAWNGWGRARGAAAAISVRVPEPVIGVDSSVQASVSLRDASGAVVEGPAVGWASGDEAIAVVDASGRLTGRAAGTTLVTATSGEVSGSATVVVSGPEWELVQASSLAPPPAGSVTRNGALGGQGMASVFGRAAWYQTSDWSMLFVPLALPEETDAFAIQASFHLPPVVDSGRAVSLVVFTSPGTKDPADLVHGRGITLDQQPGRSPVYFYGVPEGWTTADVTSTGPMAAPITGRWRTLRIEGSRAQCWLRVLLDGEEIHTGTGPCDPTGGRVMLGSLHGGGRPVNGAWTDLRVFRGATVASMDVEVIQPSASSPHAAKARVVLRDARGNRLSGRVIRWESSDPGIATVDANGAVLGIRKGEVTLTARCEGRTASSVVAVEPRADPR